MFSLLLGRSFKTQPMHSREPVLYTSTRDTRIRSYRDPKAAPGRTIGSNYRCGVLLQCQVIIGLDLRLVMSRWPILGSMYPTEIAPSIGM